MKLRCATMLFAALGIVEAAAQLPQPPFNAVPVERLAQLPPGAFLESIAVTRDGTLLIVEHTDRAILRFRPGQDTAFQVVARLGSLGVTGIVLDIDDTVYLTGRPYRAQQQEALYRLDAAGRAEPWAAVPEGRFLNGATLLRPGVILVADSFAGTIWRIDLASRDVRAWLTHPLLAPNPTHPRIPGANGIKLHGGHAYVSNSGQARVIRVPIAADGSAGTPESWAEGVVIDDFAMSADGDLYGTTHIFDSVVVLRQDGSHSTIARAEHGVTGSTAAAFGVMDADRDQLYVIGDGGVFQPPSGGLVPAELVRLRVGAPGLGRDEAFAWLPRPAHVTAAEGVMIHCDTAPGTEHLRGAIGPAYLRYLELNAGRLLLGGQVFEDRAAAPVARLYVLRGAGTDAARAFIEASPYHRAGLYRGCAISLINTVIGDAIGGVAWPEAATRATR